MVYLSHEELERVVDMLNYIKEYRKESNMTQQQLADACGCARETIGNLESGKYEPSFALMDKIACALGVSVYKLAMSPLSVYAYEQEIKEARKKAIDEYIDNFMEGFKDLVI